MKKLYKPDNEVELSLIKSLIESERIPYFVHNDHFGSLKIGPQIDMFNSKMIMVPEEHYAKAVEIISDYLGNVQDDKTDKHVSQYSFKDKTRMVAEAILFFWFVPGKGRKKNNKN